jgi:hypothetical protein
MLIVWVTFEIGGMIGLIGCVASHSLFPCILPAFAAFIFYINLSPNGSAMRDQTGNSDDPEIYCEPR